MRARRLALTPSEQRKAARFMAIKLVNHNRFKQAKSCAFYLPNDGEISPMSLVALALKRGKACYLPALATDGRMRFRRYLPPQRLEPNRYGIPEPGPTSPSITPTKLDIVFMPVVAFDEKGSRLGMGGGYYDRTFAFKHQRPGVKPLLIGLAHDCQQITRLTSDKWDIGMDFIATDRRIVRVI